MKKHISTIISLASLTMIFYILFNQKQQIRTLQSEKSNVDSLHKVIDSLKAEIFTNEIEVSRYEIIFDRAEAEMTPECKEELEAIRKTVE